MKKTLRMKCPYCSEWNRIEVNKIFVEQPSSERKVKVLIPFYKPLKIERRINATIMRIKKTVTLPKDVVEWLEKNIKERRFSNISHGLEYAVYQLMKHEKRECDKNKD